jgi:hypothetical protein
VGGPTFPVLKNPANRHKAVTCDFEQWNYAFTNTFPEERARALFERYAIPVSGHILFESALADLIPGHGGTYVDDHDDEAHLARRPAGRSRRPRPGPGWARASSRPTAPA